MAPLTESLLTQAEIRQVEHYFPNNPNALEAVQQIVSEFFDSHLEVEGAIQALDKRIDGLDCSTELWERHCTAKIILKSRSNMGCSSIRKKEDLRAEPISMAY